MADITLVNLNLLYVRYVDGVEKELHLPLGLLYLVRVLEDAGFGVDFRDYQTADYDNPFCDDSIVDFCRDPAPVIGLSCMANLLPFSILAAKALKERYPDRLMVLGGVGPKAVEAEVLERFPWIDAVAYGEGERSVIELAAAAKNGGDISRVPGLFVRRDGRVCRNDPPRRVVDLDTIGFPAYERVDLGRYDAYGMISSRGCPYLCTFCSVAPIWGRRPHFRSVANIIDEMRLVSEKTGTDLFLFQDEFFVCDKPRVLEFCRELRRQNLKLRWKAFGRVNITDRETMEAMAGSGCVEIRYGIESGSEKVLERTRKGFTVEQAMDVVSQAIDLFPRVDTFFIWGFPFETMEDFHRSVFTMLSFRLMGARILPSLLSMLPQTDIYEEYRTDPKLEFPAGLMPEYMLTGHEICRHGQVSLPQEHAGLFEFIRINQDLFPGFLLYDVKNNILPKFQVLQEHGFYSQDRLDIPTTESCGAHSPRVAELT